MIGLPAIILPEYGKNHRGNYGGGFDSAGRLRPFPRFLSCHLFTILEPFSTTKPAGKSTDLGKLLAYGVVLRHHGRAKIRNELGKEPGARVTLPMERMPIEEKTDRLIRICDVASQHRWLRFRERYDDYSITGDTA